MHNFEQMLFNNLPEQSKAPKSGFNLNASAIDNWFDELPLANVRLAVKAIYLALKETNSYQINFKKRLYLLEKIHAPAIELSMNLKKLNLNRELPLDEKRQRIAILVRKLHNQLATSYKIVLRDLLNCNVILMCPGKSRSMALAISRIIRHHSLSLIANYQFYASPYPGLWSEVHHLFLLAYREKLLDKKLLDPSLQLVSETTVKNVYLEILLISVADPYRMAQHHIASIYQQLEEWSALADIRPLQDDKDGNKLILDLSKDTHPAFVSHLDKTEPSYAWTLDTSKLDYAHLIEHFGSPDTKTTEINAELLKQLSLAWGIIPSRQHNRRPSKSRLKVAIGLNNVHYVLNGNREPDWLEPEPGDNEYQLSQDIPIGTSFDANPVGSTTKVNDIWGEIFNSRTLQGKKKTIEPAAIKTETRKIQPHSHDPKEWDLVNESVGGYCLLWDNTDTINAKVGEIIAISHEEEKKEGLWFIGTIRWMKCVASRKVQIGVQIMAPNAIAVSTAKYSNMQEGMKSRAILLPAIPVLQQPKTLITTSLGYNTRDQIMLNEYRLENTNLVNVKSKLVLMDTLEVSSHFSRFKFKQADEYYGTTTKKVTTVTEDYDTLSLDTDSDFDAIWDDL